ncbi:MAG TPA: hypothetical protein PKV96_02880 [Candidatus Saccharimonas sp.]|jgi:hypothetical protein|nr:hypothetical protein [Candidatus Saccharimonas sp.]
MPRRNKSPRIIKSIPQQPAKQKTRYTNEHDARRAADYQMRHHLDLVLRVYQSPTDGGWYLTSSPDTSR